MAIKPPFTDVDIPTADQGFYEGHSIPIATISKAIMVGIVLWALIWPLAAGAQLASVKWTLLEGFNRFYVLAAGFFAFFLFIIALLPQTGKRVLGDEGEKPEFSTFSWFAMMFGAGLGVGLMVFATAEPLGLWGSNPETVRGNVEGNTPEGLQAGYRYTFLHYGFHAWAIYVATGLSLCYYAYTRGMPLTIRTALTPLFGRFINSPFGHVVDVIGVVATILGVSVTIGFGVSQFVDGVYAITGMEWMMNMTGDAPAPSTVGLIAGLIMIMGLSILSAVSGVGRGIKWLSNANLVMSFILIMTFVIFGSFTFAMSTYGSALVDYIFNFLNLSFGAHGPQSLDAFAATTAARESGLSGEDLAAVYSGATNAWGSLDGFRDSLPEEVAALPAETTAALYAAGTDGRLFGWQAGWTTFYWAWWIAFAPFVGLFLARISRGRTIREFVLGAVIAPSLVCFAWMTILGGSAIDLELSGVAEGTIISASNTAKLFVTLGHMIDGGLLTGITIMSVVLILTFLVTSADSGILVMNTIMSGGQEETGIKHRIIWGVILTSVIGVLLVAGGGGMDALSDAMIIGALPFAVIMVLMCISLGKALFNDHRRMQISAAEPAE
ncbi:BCCT family transporter [Roseinatronobacter monicus]|uniref:BCCT, betaine/carnitine/choline family transporter n=1 Tax=Roseinatronobacter monicus TaxID=393481 RepID=A0A543K9Y0_9RHOB|nr:BCCT family transporter [Roseinatronobacter monicus]TQM91856.1 BCCT, betaine/carnitine/choline family transporter [Roseinatronobacter monicus]